jgi:xylulokinase
MRSNRNSSRGARPGLQPSCQNNPRHPATAAISIADRTGATRQLLSEIGDGKVKSMIRQRRLLLGIDLGTSGLKTALISADEGKTVATALQSYRPQTPKPGWAEQNPETWVESAVTAVRQVVQGAGIDTAAVAGIGLSGQMHSTVLLNVQGRPVRPAILWLDQRSTPQAADLRRRIGDAQLADWLGNPVLPGFTLTSLLWLRENEPENWVRAAHVVLPKDYLRFRMTGLLATDLSDASGTCLLNTGRRAWCESLLAEARLPAALLPPLIESTQVAGTLQPEMAGRLGLPAGLPVVCGAGDQQAQAIGNGLLRPGPVSCTIGTGGQLFAVANSYLPDPRLRLHTFCHAVPGLWHWLAATLSAGLSLRWLRDQVLDGGADYAQLADAAATIEPGSEGLVFLPHLAGERTPHMNPHARGIFYGLALCHTWRHMARAVMEGVVFSLLDGLELIRDREEVPHIIASGGGTQHPLWLQLQADIFGLPVVSRESPEAAALGSALLAGVGLELYPDLETACRVAVRRKEQVVQPDLPVHARYQELAGRYRELYRALAPRFRADSGLRAADETDLTFA